MEHSNIRISGWKETFSAWLQTACEKSNWIATVVRAQENSVVLSGDPYPFLPLELQAVAVGRQNSHLRLEKLDARQSCGPADSRWAGQSDRKCTCEHACLSCGWCRLNERSPPEILIVAILIWSITISLDFSSEIDLNHGFGSGCPRSLFARMPLHCDDW